MKFKVLKDWEVDESVHKVKVQVEAPKRKFATDEYMVFNEQKKVVDFLKQNGYNFVSWQCMKAETVSNENEESRIKVWSFRLKKEVVVKPKTVRKPTIKKEEVNERTTTRTTTRRRRATAKKKKD